MPDRVRHDETPRHPLAPAGPSLTETRQPTPARALIIVAATSDQVL